MKKHQWLNVVETISVIGSISGAIASVFYSQVALASIPLSLSVTLNLVNRRRLLDTVAQSNQTAIAQIAQEKSDAETKFGILSEQLVQLQQLTADFGLNQDHTNLAIAQITQEQGEAETKFGNLSEQLAQLQQLTSEVGQSNNDLQNYVQSLTEKQQQTTEMVHYLREIETCNQRIRSNANDPQAYYNRGVIYQQIGDREAAIIDYNETIETNPSYAEGYYNRGLVRSELGDKKGAIADLREAAKLFFEAGDIANYQTARNLSKNLHEISLQSHIETSQVSCLFS